MKIEDSQGEVKAKAEELVVKYLMDNIWLPGRLLKQYAKGIVDLLSENFSIGERTENENRDISGQV